VGGGVGVCVGVFGGLGGEIVGVCIDAEVHG